MKRKIRIAALCATVSAAFWMITGMTWWFSCPADTPACGREFVILNTHIGLILAGIASYFK